MVHSYSIFPASLSTRLRFSQIWEFKTLLMKSLARYSQQTVSTFRSVTPFWPPAPPADQSHHRSDRLTALPLPLPECPRNTANRVLGVGVPHALMNTLSLNMVFILDKL